eukprot:GHUV01001576.1.p1 GENE.GHUV01001576.1~~GHUV01001576.1.p1  ORF type:complete len:180 (+),score=41.77 GHUV01001576.1:184-723(+)
MQARTLLTYRTSTANATLKPSVQRLVACTRPSTRGVRVCAADDQPHASTLERLSYDKILLTILDSNPYLSDGSRQAISTAADLARIHKSKVTVLVVDHPGTEGDPAVKLGVINKSLHEAGCEDAEILEKSMESGSVLVGDVADEISADLLVISSEAVHTKQVDANLLAEFVPCPVLLLP